MSESQPAEEPAPELTGGEEAAISNAVMSESQPAAKFALELIGRSSQLTEAATLTKNAGVADVSRVLQVIVAVAFVSYRRCTRLRDDSVFYIVSKSDRCVFASLAVRTPGCH